MSYHLSAISYQQPTGNQRRGFTLAEVLIAIGIMGVGLSMVAMLFPVAIMENEASVNCSVGSNLCANGLDVAKLVLKHGDLEKTGFLPRTLSKADSASPVPATPDPSGTGQSGDSFEEWVEDIAPNLDVFYPKTLKGSLVFAGQVVPGQNSYQLLVVSYTKNEPTNVIQADRASLLPPGKGKPLDIEIDTDADEYVITNTSDFAPEYLQLDMMVIFPNGQFAKIAGTNEDGNYYFDRPVPTGTAVDAWFIVERVQPDVTINDPFLKDSPCMSVLVTRTAVSD